MLFHFKTYVSSDPLLLPLAIQLTKHHHVQTRVRTARCQVRSLETNEKSPIREGLKESWEIHSITGNY